MMIPTTATNSSPVAAAAANGSPMNGNNSSATGAQQQNTTSLMIGIASLILEGRAVAEDEYHQPGPKLRSRDDRFPSTSPNTHSKPATANANEARGRQSPLPSTSRDATVINITTNPRVYASSGSGGTGISPVFVNLKAAAESQRWSQKLCQLRQESPAGSFSGSTETHNRAGNGQAEYVALAINDSATSNNEVADYEIVRRFMLKWPNDGTDAGSSASTSPGSVTSGSDNFLHSLQSLASTCLRGSSATAAAAVGRESPSSVDRAATPPEYPGYHYAGVNTTPLVAAMSPIISPTAKYQASSFASPPSLPIPFGGEQGTSPSASNSGSGMYSPWGRLSEATTASIATQPATPPQSSLQRSSLAVKLSSLLSSPAAPPTTTTSSKYPQQGPHCDQFLRKMGLAKGEAAEADDHFCDMSYVNITCSRWRAYCVRMEAILARGDPLCIEVYLGPASHKILLEQWVITLKDKVPPPTMTLPSLCSAIRSQLYFSQISAWCDLIKKSDHTIYDSGRIIFPTTTGAAGDLAFVTNSPGSSPLQPSELLGHIHNTSAHHTQQQKAQPYHSLARSSQRPRLHIFYRVKQYDNTACFNSKPNVHNFPNVNMSDNSSISVCLKSLPRINGGIPKIGTFMSTTAVASGEPNRCSGQDVALATTPTSSSATIVKTTSRGTSQGSQPNGTNTTTNSPAMRGTPAGNNMTEGCSNTTSSALAKSINKNRTANGSSANGSGDQKGQYKCKFFIDDDDEELDDDDDDPPLSNGTTGISNGLHDTSNGTHLANGNISHREKQLLKYRKRMQKRDKTKQRAFALNSNENSIEHEQQPMEQGDEDDSRSNGTSRHIEMISTGTQTAATCCQQCGSEKSLVCLKCCRTGRKSRRDTVSPYTADLDGMESSSSTGSISSSDIIRMPRNQGERLLQSIQRTPKAAKKQKKAMRAAMKAMEAESAETTAMAMTPGVLQVAVSPSDCQGCKRQKTQHDFSSIVNGSDEKDGGGHVGDTKNNDKDAKAQTNGVVHDKRKDGKSAENAEETEIKILESECFVSSTKLTPHIDRCSLQPARRTSVYIENRCCTPPMTDSGDILSLDDCNKTAKAQFKTPTAAANQLIGAQNVAYLHHNNKQTPHKCITLITTACSAASVTSTTSSTHSSGSRSTQDHGFEHFSGASNGTPKLHHSSLLMRKGLPKVNLTPIFCNPTAALSGLLIGSTSPISITCSSADTANTSGTFSFDADALEASSLQHCSAPSIPNATADNNNGGCSGTVPVQKSYSAPTLPNSPSLSPRFAKQAAIYKRRSRHLSDRSDRSSLGSDEQYSDEDLTATTNGFFYNGGRNFSRAANTFRSAPLVGNLEECLLKKRLVPMVEVAGFKVQLGASGGFCPTQLTFPAVSHFYELPGDTLSCPYVCEIRLPRKGYAVPRVGHIQATLLNTIGTVVRMFVIPYDMRDMPALHQTFIRQRILAQPSKADQGGLGDAAAQSAAPQTNERQLTGLDGGGDIFINNNNNNNNNVVGNKYNSSNNNNGNVKYRLSPSGSLHSESNLGHFISAENMKRLRYSIHLRFQTSRSGRLSLHSDIRILISRRTDLDTAAAHAKGAPEAPSDLVTDTVTPSNPKYSARQESPSSANSLTSTPMSLSSSACNNNTNKF